MAFVEVTMRIFSRIGLCGVLVLLSGCGLTQTITRNIVTDQLKYDYYSDGWSRHARDKSLAHEAWEQVCSRDGDVYSRHYYRGFVAGFTDYLDLGGDGQPPVTPPREYWRIYYQNPEGQLATQDWFTGFRHGADVARNSGVRELVLVPVSTLPAKENDYQQTGDTTPRPKKAPMPEETKTEAMPKTEPAKPDPSKPATNPPAGGATTPPANNVKPPEPGLPKLGSPSPMGNPPPATVPGKDNPK